MLGRVKPVRLSGPGIPPRRVGLLIVYPPLDFADTSPAGYRYPHLTVSATHHKYAPLIVKGTQASGSLKILHVDRPSRFVTY